MRGWMVPRGHDGSPRMCQHSAEAEPERARLPVREAGVPHQAAPLPLQLLPVQRGGQHLHRADQLRVGPGPHHLHLPQPGAHLLGVQQLSLYEEQLPRSIQLGARVHQDLDPKPSAEADHRCVEAS